MDIYNQAASAYKSKLDAYNTAVQEWNKNPYGSAIATYDRSAGKYVGGVWVEGDFRVNGQLINDWLASVGSPTRFNVGPDYASLRSGQSFQYMKAAPAKVTDKAPVAPTAPTAPAAPTAPGPSAAASSSRSVRSLVKTSPARLSVSS